MMNKEKTIGWNFDNSYSNLPKSFIYEISPVPVKKPELIILNYDLADQMGLNFSKVMERIWSYIMIMHFYWIEGIENCTWMNVST